MLIHKAIEFAAVKHRNQVRKGTDTPYIVHPMEVMYILAETGCDETVVAAGGDCRYTSANHGRSHFVDRYPNGKDRAARHG